MPVSTLAFPCFITDGKDIDRFDILRYMEEFIVGGKWKWLIIYALSEQGILRYSRLKKSLPNITHKMLAQELKELEAEQLVFRNEYPQVPPKVEYSLTAKGETLIPILDKMADWGRRNMTLS